MFPAFNGSFLHGIDLSNWYPVYNLPINGTLFSGNYLLKSDPSFRGNKCIEDLSPEELKDFSQCAPPILTPMALRFYISTEVKRGNHIRYGNFNSRLANPKQIESLIKKGEIEYKFEIVRRYVSPSSSSRLGCLFE